MTSFTLQPLERLYGVGDGHVRGCDCLAANERADGAEEKLEVVYGVVALDLDREESERYATRGQRKREKTVMAAMAVAFTKRGRGVRGCDSL